MIWLSKVFHNDDAIWRARLLIQNRFEEELSVTIKRTNQYPSIDLVIPLNASKDCSIYIYNVWDQRTPEMKRRADRSLDKKHSASQLDKLRRWDEYRVEDVIFEYYSRCSIPHTVVHPKCDRSPLDWRNWKSNAIILDWRDRRLASILLISQPDIGEHTWLCSGWNEYVGQTPSPRPRYSPQLHFERLQSMTATTTDWRPSLEVETDTMSKIYQATSKQLLKSATPRVSSLLNYWATMPLEGERELAIPPQFMVDG